MTTSVKVCELKRRPAPVPSHLASYHGRVRIILLLTLCFSIGLAQQRSFTVEADALWITPVGSLGDRFLPALGGTVALGIVTKSSPTWSIGAEYFLFERENSDKFLLTRRVQDGGTVREVQLPLPLLSMKLESFALTGNAGYRLLGTSFVEASATVGLGIYYWRSSRGAYFDTLEVQTITGPVIGEILHEPEVNERDWAGGFEVGANVRMKIIRPIWFNIGVRMKMVVGELESSLPLELEKVSTFKMVGARIGLHAIF